MDKIVSDVLFYQHLIEGFDTRCPIDNSMEDALNKVIDALGDGHLRVAEYNAPSDRWIVNPWTKKAISLYFTHFSSKHLTGNNLNKYFDKITLKTAEWSQEDFLAHGFRMVPGAIVRRGAYIGPKVVLMPSFVNIGAYVGEGTMIDTWATVGSCAQIGSYCHISGGVGIGGVLEPAQAHPVIIEDNVFIGARSEIAEGVHIGEGSVISMGVFIGASTPIIDRATGETTYGHIPPYSVVIAGMRPSSTGEIHLPCAVIVKRVDERTRSKTSINELLRIA